MEPVTRDSNTPRIVIVGAGPAGTRCAEVLVAQGHRPILLDENSRDGGQIYRRQPVGFRRSYATLYGTEAAKAQALHQTFDRLRGQLDYRPDTLVWGMDQHVLFTQRHGEQREVPFDRLILCTGATDRLLPVEGWQWAGTYSLGGAQIALKAQSVAIGRRVVFMGTGPLLYLVAAQYVKAGAQVAAVLDTSTLSQRFAALPKMLARPGVLFNGLGLMNALRRAKVAVHTGVRPLEIHGNATDGVQGVSFSDSSGQTRRLECDAVALGYHLRPETQLADLARCAFEFESASGQFVLQLDADGRTSSRGVYAAGDSARTRGADAAEAAGRLVAATVLHDVGQPLSGDFAEQQRTALATLERFRLGLAQAFPWPAEHAAQLDDSTIICRCEAITAGELREVVRVKSACEANRAKAFSRVGMGRCQGRYCAQAGAQIIASEAGIAVQEVGRLRGQAPVRPLTIALRALPDEALS
ncbi:FAD/NAD(P)-binding oxidoreductase [Pseudomonas sp. dw_358]|uniref:FAD/NAD(P)-dependent oxidoreductase n=1 Tax=Pseudomonas sp. dw_358 TaxID=2720083 RepID=UPI001BD53D33|nr:FAD/NAD(P)-binding oxidoreductase [Pseudomonas sp. dw_358]